MLKMCPDMMKRILCNQNGIGLITAIFVIVVVGMFGVLISRFAMVSSVASAEDYYWAQALYSAQSSAQMTILYDDRVGGGTSPLSDVADFTVSSLSIAGGNGVRASAEKSFNNLPIKRTIEIYISQ